MRVLHVTGRSAFPMPCPQPWRLLDDITHLALAVQVLEILINLCSFFSVYPPFPHASFQAEFEFIFMLTKSNYARKSNTKTLKTLVISQSEGWKDQRTHLRRDSPAPNRSPPLSQPCHKVRVHGNQLPTYPAH